MALVHEKLYQSADLARVDFRRVRRSLLDYLWRAHGAAAAGVRLTLDTGAGAALRWSTAVPCGLILNELASNALKHAFRGRAGGEVTVALPATAGQPPGVPARARQRRRPAAGLDWRQSRSLGLRLVQMLASRSAVTWRSRGGDGTEFRVTFDSDSAMDADGQTSPEP